MKIASVLHRYGASSDRVEAALYQLSDKLNLPAEYLSLPTSFMANFKVSSDDEYTRILRLDPGKINLEKLYSADQVVDSVVNERISLQLGIEQLDNIISRKNIHSDIFVNISVLVLSFCVAIVLGGNWQEATLSGLLGFTSGIFSSQAKLERIDTIKEGILCFLIGFISFVTNYYMPHINPQRVILASIIFYVPGLNLNMAMGELASQNLTAGTARLAGALIIILKIVFGAFLGGALAQRILSFEVTSSVAEMTLFVFPAVLLIALSFVVSFQSRWQESGWMVLAGFSSFTIHYFLKGLAGNLAAILITGIYIGALGNIYARLLNRPSIIVSLPAIILLVPGAVSFQGFEYLFVNETLSGINALFATFNIGLALVVGTYFGSLLVKPRRII